MMTSTGQDRSLRFWRRTQLALKTAIVVTVGFGAWLIGFQDEGGPAPVLPDIESEIAVASDLEIELQSDTPSSVGDSSAEAADAFSLDLKLTASVDHDLVYVVEQRARPNYRIFSLEPDTGAIETVFTVPDQAIIYGIALSPDRETLAVAYTPDFELEGSGIYLLDLESGELDPAVEVERGVHFVDLAWSPDGETVLATEVDRRGGEELAAVEIVVDSGQVVVRIDDAINPVKVGHQVVYLAVAADQARRSIGVWTADGTAEGATRELEIGDGGWDLDHLSVAAGSSEGTVRVAVLDRDSGGFTLGSVAEAHGSHEVPSTWIDVDLDDATTSIRPYEPAVVFDAVATADGLFYATKTGLSIAIEDRTDVIASRAIRFVAG